MIFKTKDKSDFSQGSIPSNILRIGLPIMVAEFVNVFYNLIDRMYIGHIKGIGTSALSGVGLCLPLITIISGFANLFATGGAPLFSIARGKKESVTAQKLLNTSFSMLLLTGVALSTVLLLFLKPILFLIGADAETFPFAYGYFIIYGFGTVFSMISLGMNAFINSQGFSGIGMGTVLIGAVLNLVLDPIFIFALDMGVQGAAIATVISQFFSAAWVLRFLLGKKAIFKYNRFEIDPACARKIVSLGIAGFAFKITTGLAQAVSNAMLKLFGAGLSTLYVGAMSIINSLRSVSNQPIFAISHGSQPIISFNYGAKQYDRVIDSIKFVTFATLLYNFVSFLLLQCVTVPLIRVFSQDTELIHVAKRCIQIYFGAYVFMALMQTGQSTFVALNMPKHALFFSIFRKIILIIPLTLILPRTRFGVDGVFYAELFSEVIGASACYITMLSTVLPMIKREKQRELDRQADPHDLLSKPVIPDEKG